MPEKYSIPLKHSNASITEYKRMLIIPRQVHKQIHVTRIETMILHANLYITL